MPAAQQPGKQSIHQLKVTLRDSKPPIWRRVQVPGNITLDTLHEVIQVIMGWEDYHLHQFIIGRKYYGMPLPDFGPLMKNEKGVTLHEVAPTEKSRFIYELQFRLS